ncbi:MAG TPA: type II toxin-antitoxin system VapC family toxin [Planctomycetota bacterium]|nr:type II toxin-antitoxin system VapC family toxin [Planctomycetota bacterium]
MAYIDTSVLVANYCPEPLSKAAQRAIRSARPSAISMLNEVEFCSAVSLKTRTGAMDADTARRILSLFHSHVEGGYYRVVPIQAAEFALAAEWIASFATSLRTVDALHLAAAYTHRLTLITADDSLAQAASHFNVKHQLLS